SMAVLPAWKATHAMYSMGATVGITKGMNKAMRKNGDKKPIVSVIGDGTFFHSGLPGFINLVHQVDEEDNMTVIILDNKTTAMTGGQHTASSGRFNEKDDMDVDIKTLLKSMGIENIQEVDQFEYKKTREIIRKATREKGISVIITTRPCALKYKI